MTNIKENFLKSVLITGNRINSLEYIKLGIMEEFGEIAGKIKRFRRGDYKKEAFKDNMKKEIGDLTWYLVLYEYKNGTLRGDFKPPRNKRVMTSIDNMELLKGHLMWSKHPRHQGLIIETMLQCTSDLAWSFGFTMEDICKANMQKTSDRLKRNMIKGSGDER